MRQLSDSLMKNRYAKSIYRLTLCIRLAKLTVFKRDMSFLTCTTRLTPQENVFLNISIHVCGDTLHEYVFACVSYRTLPLCSTYSVGFRDNNMLSSCFDIYWSNFCTNDCHDMFSQANVNRTSVIFV